MAGRRQTVLHCPLWWSRGGNFEERKIMIKIVSDLLNKGNVERRIGAW